MKPIIIAEDYASTRRALVRALAKRYDTQVDGVENGRQLVERVRDGDHSFVLTDRDMPIMGGLEATREIRKTHPDIPIVMMSGLGSEEEALAAGANAFVKKSFSLQELYAATDRFAVIG